MKSDGPDRRDPFDAIDEELRQQLLAQTARNKAITRAQQRQPSKRPTGAFVTVPLWWVERLRQAKRASTFLLALDLLYRAWRLKNYDALAVSNIVASQAGVSRSSKWRALRELERLGLVIIRSKKRQAPTVQVLLEP
jgi:hypothetical protein